jgi:hypothetical protein
MEASPVKIANLPQIAVYPLRPEADVEPAAQPAPPAGEGKVVWASPDLAKALSGAPLGLSGIPGWTGFDLRTSFLLNTGISVLADSGKPPIPNTGLGSPTSAAAVLGQWPGIAKVSPFQPQEAKVGETLAQGIQFLDDAGISVDDTLHELVNQSVQNGFLSANCGKLFSCTIAGTEILLELIHPSEKTRLERTLSIALNSVIVFEPITEFIPHLACVRPYLVGVVEVGGQIMAAIHSAAKDAAKNAPLGTSFPRKNADSGRQTKK